MIAASLAPGLYLMKGVVILKMPDFISNANAGPYFEAIVLFKTTATIRREKGARRSIKERDAAFCFFVALPFLCITYRQGDTSHCLKPPVDFKTKVPFWPGLA